MLKKWDELPKIMRTEAVRPYYDILKKKKISLIFKRIFDFIVAILLLTVLLPIFIIISILIKIDSKGDIIYQQERITQYGRKFKIFKFRTMVADADKIGSQVTMYNDNRITKMGRFLRKYRLDELPQLFNVLLGDMSFVGTRPESIVYMKAYSQEMLATLLLPAGVTSEASIFYKDEAELLKNTKSVDEEYINTILPKKMKYNLESIKKFCFMRDIIIMIATLFVVIMNKAEDKKERKE